MKTDRELAAKALATYGNDAQLEMINKESAEVILAMAKIRRLKFNFSEDKSRKTEDAIEDFLKEVADMHIVLQYAELIYGGEFIQSVIEMKENRLRKRLGIKP